MKEFGLNEMHYMQEKLQDKYKNQWEPISQVKLREAYIAKFESNMKR